MKNEKPGKVAVIFSQNYEKLLSSKDIVFTLELSNYNYKQFL